MQPTAVELTLRDLPLAERAVAVPVVTASFTGIYRWHAKRTLLSISRVRGAWAAESLAGISMLEFLEPPVGYVYYVAVRAAQRRRGVARRLLDDAIELFDRHGARVIFAAAEQDNTASIRLFAERGFRITEPKERSWRDGGLGAWGLRSRMMVVNGEVLMGRRLHPEPSGAEAATPGPTASLPSAGDRQQTTKGL
jgi:ribosomal protein S18 acetylase RimI-like enzyme